MRIALIGSAPSSVRLGPYGDPSWIIWGCSPGAYPTATRVDAWFELHRQEAPVLGVAEQQKPWLSPEYWAWMGKQKLVWMVAHTPDIPNSRPLPVEALCKKYGHYFFASSLSWMFAMAIDAIQEDRKGRAADVVIEDVIGLWGVDMSASEEYHQQRPGCQFFATLATNLGIKVTTPPESDLLRPAPLYGIHESSHRHIKGLERIRELESRIAMAQQKEAAAHDERLFLQGAIDDMKYNLDTWLHEGPVYQTDFATVLAPTQSSLPDVPELWGMPLDSATVNSVDFGMEPQDKPEPKALRVVGGKNGNGRRKAR